MTSKKQEKKQYYMVVRMLATDIDFVVEMVTVEELFMTWSEFIKYVKKNYVFKTSRKRYGYAVVA